MPTPEERENMRTPTGLGGPTKETVSKLQEMAKRIQQAEHGRERSENSAYVGHKPIAPLAYQVNSIIEQRNDLCSLCGEMLATFSLPSNQEHFAKLGPNWASAVEGWKRQFAKVGGEPSSLPTKKPTIAELEAIINDPTPHEVTVRSDGSCVAVPKIGG